MALKSYKITYDNGAERYRKLDDTLLKQFQDAAKSKTSDVKSVTEGKPTPRNKS